jgi:hypothetical protein
MARTIDRNEPAVPRRAGSLDAMNVLSASPFALLDARGSLRLVTDVVHEDDALELTCVHRRPASSCASISRPAPIARLQCVARPAPTAEGVHL